jgi:hypothetical protein
VEAEPRAPLGAVASIMRFRVRGLPEETRPESLVLYADPLSPYHEGRLRKNDVPNTLAERAIAALTWSEPAGVVLAPTQPLEPGRIYSLALPSLGLLAEVRVSSAPQATFLRFWPPPRASEGLRTVVFCGEGAPPKAAEAVFFEPGHWAARYGVGIGPMKLRADRCFSLEVSTAVTPGVRLLPPVRLGSVALDPTPLAVNASPEPEVLEECAPPRERVGSLCARPEDDRIELCARGGQRLYALRVGEQHRVKVLDVGDCELFRGLTPGAKVALRGTAFDIAGTPEDLEATFVLAPTRAHLTLNEVLANPRGKEPTQEWVELYNDGSASVELANYRLADAGAETKLPAHTLARGSFVLLVSEKFEPGARDDVPFPPDAAVLRLPALGKAGLANSGEVIRLLDPSGLEVSRVPARAAARAGVSLARCEPGLGPDPVNFALHAAPGASPGAPNLCEETDAGDP